MKRGLIGLVLLLLVPGALADVVVGPELYFIPAGVIIFFVVIVAIIIWLVIKFTRKKKKK